MSNKITTCPKAVNVSAVGATIRPVTQVAEVAVKSASMNLRSTPSLVEKGSIKSKEPTRIIIAKPNKSILAVVRCLKMEFLLDRVRSDSFKLKGFLINCRSETSLYPLAGSCLRYYISN